MGKVRCPRCKQKIDPWLVECPNCYQKQSAEARAKALDCTVVEIKCPKCGCDQSFFFPSYLIDVARCVECDTTTYSSTEGKAPVRVITPPPTVKCPYCNSTNTTKISTTSKVVRVATLGIFGVPKATKQWHCNNCKSDF